MKVLLLAGNTLRARAYAQTLSKIENIVVVGILYGFSNRNCEKPYLNKETSEFFINESLFIPSFDEDLEITFKKNKWAYSFVLDFDVNSKIISDEVKKYKPDMVLFSGYGGQILSEVHFLSKIPYIHVHPGILPNERGSTTIYYSILSNRNCGATAFIMTEEIDNGNIIVAKEYPTPQKNVDIDNWYDNIIRADCMQTAIEQIKKKDFSEFSYNDKRKSESVLEYYIIHPLLKHIAILKTGSNK